MQFVCRVLIVEFQWPMISNSNVGMFTVAFYCVIFNILIQIKPWMFPYLYILKYLVTFFLIILSERETINHRDCRHTNFVYSQILLGYMMEITNF